MVSLDDRQPLLAALQRVGSGSSAELAIVAVRFGGTPLHAADVQAFEEGNCQPPTRRVLPGGQVVQMYPLTANPAGHMWMRMSIYLPSGVEYSFALQNSSYGPDMLPITKDQFAALGVAVTPS